MLPGEVYDGPDVVRVRALVTRLRRASALIPIEPTLQETYARWHDERDRDLLHLTLHLGQGVGQAARALEAQSTPCEGSRGCVGRVGWAHAVYAVNAEAVMCLRVSTFLARAVDRARRYKRLQILVAEAQEGVRRAGERDESFQAKKTRDLGQREAELAEAAEALDGYYRHGGTPPIDSVDTAGERIIAMQCRRAAREMAARAGDG